MSQLVSDNGKFKEPVFLISVPKCGTVLLLNILELTFGIKNRGDWLADHALTHDPKFENKFYNGHLYYTAKGFDAIKNYKKILLYRDPRDYVVSHAHFFNKIRTNTAIEKFFQKGNFSIEQKINHIIKGVEIENGRLPSVLEMFERMNLFWKSKNSFLIKYEDLLGTEYGGDDKKRFDTILKLLNWLSFPIPENLKDRIIVGANMGKKLGAFRKGIPGDWKNHFTDNHKLFFKLHAPYLVSRLGYEKDENW